MAKGDAGNVIGNVAHLLHLVAQIYLGVLVILVLPPIMTFPFRMAAHDGPPFETLYILFGEHWGKFSGVSFGEALILLGGSFIVGVMTSQFAYELGRRSKYHDNLSVTATPKEETKEEQQRREEQYFAFRCSLLEYPHLQRLWDWEQLQFDLCYYMEIALMLFLFALLYALGVGFALAQKSGTWILDRWFVATFILFVFVGLLLGLARTARKSKLETFCGTHSAIEREITRLRGGKP